MSVESILATDYGFGAQAWAGVGDPDARLFSRPARTEGPRAKPSGFFTSTWDAERRSSAWLDFLRTPGATDRRPREAERVWTFAVSEDTRLYIVDSDDDYRRLAGFLPQHYGNPKDPRYAPNWHDLARLDPLPFDGVHVTTNALASPPRGDHPELSGWDVESTLWLAWPVTNARCIGRIIDGWVWRRDAHD